MTVWHLGQVSNVETLQVERVVWNELLLKEKGMSVALEQPMGEADLAL